MSITSGGDLTKLFGVNLLTLFSKLHHFINISNIYGIAMKRPSLQKVKVNLWQKSFIRSTPGSKTFL